MSCNVSSELVTVAVFATSADAALVQGQLTAASIESQLTKVDDAGPPGQIHVQVAQGDFERAMRLLFPVPERSRAPAKEIGSWTCPKCSQVVFDFSSVCWLCGTSREGAPPTPIAPATSTPVADSPEIATAEPIPSTVAPSLPPVPLPPPAAPLPDAASAAPRSLRFARLPLPPPGMVPVTEPPPVPGGVPQAGPGATPRFARLNSLEAPAAETPATKLSGKSVEYADTGPSMTHGVATEFGGPAGMAAPVKTAPESASPEATLLAAPLPARFITPVGPAAPVRARVDVKQKEIESMTVWAWWTAVVGELICPATVYSIWLLLTLTFAAARPSPAGRRRFIGAWCLNVAVIVVWFILLQSRM